MSQLKLDRDVSGTVVKLLCALATASSCGFPNPQDCLDGVCSDSSRPFCDEDGAISGFHHTCLAVACVAGTFGACRDDGALICNTSGTSYDVVACPLGCGSSGCRECTDDEMCRDAAPVCDRDSQRCRRCKLDDEYPSRVCDLEAGACLPEASVVYASPLGSGSCSQMQPCSIANAVALARSASHTPVIRLLPGSYTAPIDIRGATSAPLSIVATGARIVPNDSSLMAHAVSVRDGANVRVRGLATLSPLQIDCEASAGTTSTLALSQAALASTANGTAMTLSNCHLELSEVDVALNVCEIVINALGNVDLSADRIRVAGNNNPHLLASGTRVAMRVTNSVLDDVLLDLDTTDTTDPGSSFLFGFDTLFLTIDGLRCDGDTAHKAVYFENSIIAGPGNGDVILGSSCQFSNTLLSRQFNARLGTTVADPHFVDAAGRDFHLATDSPAIDAAVRAASGLESIADLDGTPRPQAGRSDLGAYEHPAPRGR
jgi:hypothetical protein